MKITPDYTVIYSDESILVLNKRSGLLIAADRYDEDAPRLDLAAEKEFGKLYAVHRIDKDTSGCVIYARTPEAHRSLSMQFEHREVEKVYHALVYGRPLWQKEHLDLRLLVDGDARHRTVPNSRYGKDAVTDFTLIGSCGPYSWVEARPRTGRTHQIRAHLKELGFAIVCDPLYSPNQKPVRLSEIKRKWNGDAENERPLLSRLALHAYRLTLNHPVSGQRLTFTAPYPKDMEATRKQLELFCRWHANCINSFEYVAREILPQPVVSATMEGCMEKGMDVMYGGAKYNSTGMAGVGLGNITDCLADTEYLVFDKKLCTAQELYDALMHNWEGYEDLRQTIANECPHYGNGNDYADKYAVWAADAFASIVNSFTGPRGRYSAGMYPVTTNVIFGKMTSATPDGRMSGSPLADGISPVQQMDKNGPTAILRSVSKFNQKAFPNGTLLNMKFHPSAFTSESGNIKLRELMQTYFELGGMEMQINVISAETLRAAQKNPDDYRNLVVRVAGFSAYFVELHEDGQNDLISRTELAM